MLSSEIRFQVQFEKHFETKKLWIQKNFHTAQSSGETTRFLGGFYLLPNPSGRGLKLVLILFTHRTRIANSSSVARFFFNKNQSFYQHFGKLMEFSRFRKKRNCNTSLHTNSVDGGFMTLQISNTYRISFFDACMA